MTWQQFTISVLTGFAFVGIGAMLRALTIWTSTKLAKLEVTKLYTRGQAVDLDGWAWPLDFMVERLHQLAGVFTRYDGLRADHWNQWQHRRVAAQAERGHA